MGLIKKILFVCTGNSCRSVMAASLLKKLLKEKAKNYEICSAGTTALEGMGPSSEAERIMLKQGIDISSHRSQRLNPQMIRDADLILVMEKAHRDFILNLVPEIENKLFLLKSFIKDRPKNFDLDIPDPIGKPAEFYEEILIVMEESLQGLIEKFRLL